MKTIIEAGRPRFITGIREIMSYNDLLYMLAYRDYKVRYAQTLLGFLWALVQPLLTLLIFILVFNKAVKVDTGAIPYPVFALTGMLAWSYFSYVLTQAGQSIISSQALVTKIYFPRLIIPVSKGIVGFIDFLIVFLLLLALMAWYGFFPGTNIIALPLLVAAVVIFSMAMGIWFSALTIRFRDLQYVIPFLVQIGLYLSPVGYPASQIPAGYLDFYYLNPMAGIIDGFRWCLLDTPLPETRFLLYSASIILVFFFSGVYYFQRTERMIADII
ncbi:MAG TPA: ABC transporter permease [Chitinophagales bacterium]|nr:ABC transporter permease [Chitinophagales bacterium]